MTGPEDVAPDWRPHPTLDVYRDKDGNPVTITPEQCRAIRHALAVWDRIRMDSGYWERTGTARDQLRVRAANSPWNSAEITKSVLLGRLLHDGLPPLTEPPPTINSCPRYDLAEEPQEHPLAKRFREEQAAEAAVRVNPVVAVDQHGKPFDVCHVHHTKWPDGRVAGCNCASIRPYLHTRFEPCTEKAVALDNPAPEQRLGVTVTPEDALDALPEKIAQAIDIARRAARKQSSGPRDSYDEGACDAYDHAEAIARSFVRGPA